MRNEILRVHKLCKSLQNKRVLNHFHMSVYEGEIFGIVGLYDSGKSVLLNILAGREGWDSGSIFFDEVPVNPQFLKQTNKIQLIDHQSRLIPTLSVLENLIIPRRHYRTKIFVNWKKLGRHLDIIFSEFGISIDRNRIVSTLTPAEQNLIEVIKAYILGAKVILMENMMAQYTHEEQQRIKQLLFQMKKKNVTFIIAEYQLANLRKYADRILILDKGHNIKVIRCEDAESFDENKILLSGIPREKPDRPERKIYDDVVFEARHISTKPGEDVTFRINKGEIAVILDLSHSTNANLIDALAGKVKYTGHFIVDGKVIRNIAKARSSVCVAVDEPGDKIIKSLDLKDNLCLSAFPRISRFGMVSARQKRQIMTDFLKLYRDRNFNFDFNIHKLSQAEATAIYLYRIQIQKWNVLLLMNPDLLLSHETVYVIQEQLRRMTENGRAICIFASTIEPYADLADSYCIIANGKVQGKYTYSECRRFLGSVSRDP
ncbi:ATP-binding cassette domain-containing protein [Cohnella laeviribosi]|uniref:ATP-binding cassette domain-containing protein n=1 Tax=Cohnella laeviribosi TaxID=380174 RepID=UPI000363B8B9|nr:ATP-binding cassette domain-containing protein [Cohnella laeviribosi]